jgi:phosphoesterase RecJ-like protein
LNPKGKKGLKMNKDSMAHVINAFRERDNFVVTSHVNPEGDSIGSQIAVYRILKKRGKKVVMVDHDEVPDNLRFLEYADSIMREIPGNFHPETFIVLDCPVRERAGHVSDHITERHMVINIDHHVSNEFFGNINWVEPDASSVGEMIYRMAFEAGVEMTKGFAEDIYTAILTDTGMFNYTNTSKTTHEIAGELLGAGVDPKEIHSKIFESKSPQQMRLLGRVLTTLQVEGGKVAHITLTEKMYAEEGLESIPTDEFINFPRSVKGVEVAVFFKENVALKDRINVSFRSSGTVDVNMIASRFGGGGHAQASGCTLNCGLEEARGKVIEEVKRAIGAGK